MDKILIIACSFIVFCINGFAQTSGDALRFSQLDPTGTSRFMSTGGAAGAIGGDFSVLSINPAAMGIYRKSELTFTPRFGSSRTQSTHYGSSVDDNRFSLNFSNVGWVATYGDGSKSGWRRGQFAVGYNRLADFNRAVSFSGENTNSSLLDTYMAQVSANGGVNYSNIQSLPGASFGSYLAWQCYLLDTSGGTNQYITPLQHYGNLQNGSIVSSGGLGETVLAVSGSYEDRFYLGASVGFDRLRYERSTTYAESVPDTVITSSLTGFSRQENLTTTGNGYNFKIGALFRLTDYVRIGVAAHTPTFITMSDDWQTEMKATYDTVSYTETSPRGKYNYTLITPWRVIGSVGIIIAKNGYVSADYELVDYSSARFRNGGDGYSFMTENNDIQQIYQPTGNLRVGAEWKLAPFSFRGGFNYLGDPYTTQSGNSNPRLGYSAGFGFREKSYFIDFAYRTIQGSEKYWIYDPSLVEATDLNSYDHTFLMTIGFRY